MDAPEAQLADSAAPLTLEPLVGPFTLPQEVIVPREAVGRRLDAVLAAVLPQLSRSFLQGLIDRAIITVDGQPAKPGLRLAAGQCILVRIPMASPQPVQPEDIPLTIIYEDADIAVIDKPAGMVVHPAPGHQSGTVVNAILALYGDDLLETGEDQRPGIVHRLDKDTSGLLLIAKNRAAQAGLAAQMKSRQVEKGYLALVEGRIKQETGTIDAPIGRHPRQRTMMAVLHVGGRASVTRYRVIERFSSHTLLHVSIETGRTHQIRVHMASIGHPVVGDTIYGYRRRSLRVRRQFLHAYQIRLVSPLSAAPLFFDIALPSDLQEPLDALRRAHAQTPVDMVEE